GFDERFAVAWREDSDLYFRLIDHGARIRHARAARVVHPIRPGGWGVSLRQQRKILYDALLFKKHRRHYRRHIRATPRWDYYAIVVALGGAVALAMLQASQAALVFAALWASLTARLCMRRLLPTARRASHL